ncbi:hypothetical protein [Pseudarthrobacter sp. DSP2-3-2b1]|uniref:hypothetical protein n=1 Tax=Pseudarthrobacter sp. DSP2-3-2b1 TaxID=2804661 RepID=UPI003CF79820
MATALLGLAVPTSKHLAGRIIMGCALYFGAVPMLWWVPRTEGLFSWGHLLFAALLSGLTVRVVTSSRRKAVLSSFLPVVNKADYLILVAGILSIVALAPYFLVFTGPQALGVLLSSWDNSSHFDMYFMLREHGTVIPMAALPGGGKVWSFMEYPQGFHAAVATMADLVVGPEKGTLAKELVTYSRLSSLVAVASTMLVAACLTSIPWIRRRPLVSAPFVVFVITAWTFGTAAHATFFAFQNFLLGVALLASFMLIAAFAESLATPVIFAAAAASVVGIANTWSLLLLLAVPALVLAVHPWITSRWQASKRCWVVNLGSVVGAVVGMVLIAQQISRIGTETVVTAGGRIQSSTHGVEIATLLVAVASSMLLVHGSPRQFFNGLGDRHAAARLVLVPAVGLVAVIAMGAYQIVSMGSVNYYSLKLALAVELLLPLVACITVTALADRWLTTHKYVNPRELAIMSVLTALASTQVFGLTVPDTRPLGMDPLAPYQKGMATITSKTLTNGPAATELFQAASAYTSDQGDAVFVTSFDQIDPLLAATWYLSLTGTHKDNTNRVLGELRPLYSGYTGNLGRAAENILDADPHVSIVLDRKLRDFLQSSGFDESKLSRLSSLN